MMDILGFNPFAKGLSKARYTGDMHCPFCSYHADPTSTPIGFESAKNKIRLVGNLGPFIKEYQCQLCGGIWRYDVNAQQSHPYQSFKRGLKITDPRLSNLGSMKFTKHYIK
jgi:hypothetical protein